MSNGDAGNTITEEMGAYEFLKNLVNPLLTFR